MLRGIPSVISPEILFAFASMGHGDEIVIGDANFPGCSVNENCIRADGISGEQMLEAIVKIMPIGDYDKPCYIMEKVLGDSVETPIWDKYRKIVSPYTNQDFVYLERDEFYERAKKAYAVIMTGERAQYANIILKKGVIREEE